MSVVGSLLIGAIVIKQSVCYKLIIFFINNLFFVAGKEFDVTCACGSYVSIEAILINNTYLYYGIYKNRDEKV